MTILFMIFKSSLLAPQPPTSVVAAGAIAAPSTPSSTTSSAPPPPLDNSTQQSPNSVLRVIVDNLIYAVTLDTLHTVCWLAARGRTSLIRAEPTATSCRRASALGSKFYRCCCLQIFSRYGKVLRIITFSKNRSFHTTIYGIRYSSARFTDTFQALVQFSEANAAQLARNALDGQNVYQGCCTLRIDYSKLATLNVRYNNDKSRDYTNSLLPAGELTIEQQLALGWRAGRLQSRRAPSAVVAVESIDLLACLLVFSCTKSSRRSHARRSQLQCCSCCKRRNGGQQFDECRQLFCAIECGCRAYSRRRLCKCRCCSGCNERGGGRTDGGECSA